MDATYSSTSTERIQDISERLTATSGESQSIGTLHIRQRACQQAKEVATTHPIKAGQLAPVVTATLREEVSRELDTSAAIVCGLESRSQQIQQAAVMALARSDIVRLTQRLLETGQIKPLIRTLSQFLSVESNTEARQAASYLLGQLGVRCTLEFQQTSVSKSAIRSIAELVSEQPAVDSVRGVIRAIGVVQATQTTTVQKIPTVKDAAQTAIQTDDPVCVAWGRVVQETLFNTADRSLDEFCTTTKAAHHLQRQIRPSGAEVAPRAAMAVAELHSTGLITGISDTILEQLEEVCREGPTTKQGPAAIVRAELAGGGIEAAAPDSTVFRGSIDAFLRAAAPVEISSFGRTVAELGIHGQVGRDPIAVVGESVAAVLTDPEYTNESIAWTFATLSQAELVGEPEDISLSQLVNLVSMSDSTAAQIEIARTVVTAGIVTSWDSAAIDQLVEQASRTAESPDSAVLDLLDDIERTAPDGVISQNAITTIADSVPADSGCRQSFYRLLETVVQHRQIQSLPIQLETVLETTRSQDTAVSYAAMGLLVTALEQDLIGDSDSVYAAFRSRLAETDGNTCGLAARGLCELLLQSNVSERRIHTTALVEVIRSRKDQAAVDAAQCLRKLVQDRGLSPLTVVEASTSTDCKRAPIESFIQQLRSVGPDTRRELVQILLAVARSSPDVISEERDAVQEFVESDDLASATKLIAVDILAETDSRLS